MSISLVALVFSILSWRESREAGIVSRSVSRANISAGPAVLAYYPSTTATWDDNVQATVTLENAGSAAAVNVRALCEMFVTQETLAGRKPRNGIPTDHVVKVGTTDTIAPHKDWKITCESHMPKLIGAPTNTVFPVFVSISATYVDEATGNAFSTKENFSSALLNGHIVQTTMSRGGSAEWIEKTFWATESLVSSRRTK